MKIRAIFHGEIIYKNGKSPLAIRFTHQRARKLVSLGFSVEPHCCNTDAFTSCNHSNVPVLLRYSVS